MSMEHLPTARKITVGVGCRVETNRNENRRWVQAVRQSLERWFSGLLLCRTARTTEMPKANGTADTTEQLIEGCRENEGTEKQPVFLSSPFFFINANT